MYSHLYGAVVAGGFVRSQRQHEVKERAAILEHLLRRQPLIEFHECDCIFLSSLLHHCNFNFRELRRKTFNTLGHNI